MRGCIVWADRNLAFRSSVRPLRSKKTRWTSLTFHRMISPRSLSTSSRRYRSPCQINITELKRLVTQAVKVRLLPLWPQWKSPCFLFQLPEPLLTFDLYTDFIAIGKTIQHLSEREPTPDTNNVMDIIQNLKKLLQKLPPCCYSTLQHMMSHLHKWACSWVTDLPKRITFNLTDHCSLNIPLVFISNLVWALLEFICSLSSQSFRELREQDVPE